MRRPAAALQTEQEHGVTASYQSSEARIGEQLWGLGLPACRHDYGSYRTEPYEELFASPLLDVLSEVRSSICGWAPVATGRM